MANLTGFAITGVIGVGLGAAGYWAYQVVQKPQPAVVEIFRNNIHIVGVNGDPPVTVSDGSLHAHSANDWTTDTDTDQQITAKPATGSTGQYTQCTQALDPITNQLINTSGVFWTSDGMLADLSATADDLTVVIRHDPKGQGQGESDERVIITVNQASAPTIQTMKGYLRAPEGSNGQQKEARYNRRHSRPGDVAEIIVKRKGTVLRDWTPSDPQNAHFEIGFCYQ